MMPAEGPTPIDPSKVTESNALYLEKIDDLLRAAKLSSWERTFLTSIEAWLKKNSLNGLSVKQKAVFDKIDDKYN